MDLLRSRRYERYEVEPTVAYAIVPNPSQDAFLFYHLDAEGEDLQGLWDYCHFCVSHLAWAHDHFEVSPNPCYLNESVYADERFSKVKQVLVGYYRAKRMVAALDLA